jgi:phosphatidylserine/phosphatidylglycerophosphate/cardiolipin synthase-like enzyme
MFSHIRAALALLIAISLAACLTDATPAGADRAVGAQNVRLIVYPDESENTLLDAIRGARTRVYLTTYLLTDLRVIDMLVQARANGAEARVLLEDAPFGGGVAAKSAFERLEKAGIPVKPGNPAFRFTHQKSLVIDQTAYVLTANMTRSAFQANREFGIVVTEPGDVAEIVAAFNADWERKPFAPASPRLIWSPINSRARINAVIASAASTLDIYAEVVQDNDQVRLMVEAARRGARVRLIAPPPDGGTAATPTDDMARLRAGGVFVRQLRAPTQHSKMMLSDGRIAYIGSQNVTATSLDLNRELGMLISDPAVLARLASVFESDWAKASER